MAFNMITLMRMLHFIAILLSGWLIMRAMSCLLPVSEKRFRRFLLFVGCTFLCSMIIFIGDPFNILGTTPVFLAIVLVTCKGGFWQKITIGLMFSSTVFSFSALRDNYIHDFLYQTVQDEIAVLLFRGNHTYGLFPEAWMQSVHGYHISYLCTLPFALILYLCTGKFAPDKEYTLSDSMWRLLLLLTVIPLGIVLDVVTLLQRYDYEVNIMAHKEYAVLLVIALLAFISLLWCVTVLARQRELERQSMFAEINRKYYEAMEQQHFEVRRLKHDLANHIQVLSVLPEEKRAAYAEELSGNTALSQSFSYCGDSTVNAVLTVKKSVMERGHIRLKTEVDIPATLPYDKTDICALYANALDNAMEACMKLEETHREISLKSKVGKGLFCLEIRNPDPDGIREQHAAWAKKQNDSAAGGESEHGAFWPTSKPDKRNHGLGLQSIREIVKRYHGHMEIKCENGVFDLFLYLPLGVTSADSAHCIFPVHMIE